jgi:DNA-binding MarR family transcriptional regulator
VEWDCGLDDVCYNTYHGHVPTDLQKELKQTKPFKNLKHEANLSIQRTAAVLHHELESAMKPFGITATQYNVLRILRGAEPDGLCRNEIRDRLVRQVPDVTRLLDRLEDIRLISRERGEQDRRFVTTRITRSGLRLLEELEDRIDAVHDEQLGHLDEAQLSTLIKLLAVVRHRA